LKTPFLQSAGARPHSYQGQLTHVKMSASPGRLTAGGSFVDGKWLIVNGKWLIAARVVTNKQQLTTSD
jgi:hypothetical protein